MSTSYWKNSVILPQESPDITIVGGGFIGLSVAYWLLLKKPSLKVWILDHQPLGEGASGRNAGFLTKGSLSFYEHLTNKWGVDSAIEVFNFAKESIELTITHLNPADVIHTRSYSLYRGQKDFHFHGFTKMTSPLEQFENCFVSEGEKSIHPLRLLECLENKVGQMGAVIYRGIQVLGVEADLVHTTRGTIKRTQGVLALNGFSESVVAGVVTPQRGQMQCVELNDDLYLSGLIYEPESRVYFKFLEPGVMVIGGKRLVDSPAEQTSLLGINPLIQQELSRYVESNLSKIKKIRAQWAGIMGFSSDELPLLEKRHSYYLIAGFSGHGMGLGFASARNVAEMITDNKTSFFHALRTRCRL